MPDSNRLTPPAGEPVPNPLFDIAVTLAPDEVAHPPTFTFQPDDPGTRTLPPSGTPNTRTFVGPDAAAGHVRTHLPGYEILGVLGRGGMGVVYKARQIKLNRVVALKLMLHADHAGPTTRERFTTEAQAVARLQHPNIVQVFEVGEIDGVPFFSLEYVSGGTLAARVSEHLLPPRDAAALVAALAGAVAYAHSQGIIHRDLKPTNILLSVASGQSPVVAVANGTPHDTDNTARGVANRRQQQLATGHWQLTPKIADFGLAKSISEDSGITRSGSVVGTPSYMPPEQAAGDSAAIGPTADIYSLGAVLYELLTGRPPFKGANVAETLALVRNADPAPPGDLQSGVPRDLETI
ncbi:MAG TPA: serine/threonine-protein kinase, partial [Gemmataceae bacterium]|nr:serine/threonine-protein kinase [Gemmataceae bacterium]